MIDDTPPSQEQGNKDIKRWFSRIKETIKYDENARKQYAIDRRYAKGDSANPVAANLTGTYIDIITSFLAAKAPDVAVTPARTVEPPSLEALRDISEDIVRQRPDIRAAVDATLEATTLMQDPNASQTAQLVIDQMVEQEILKQYEVMRKTYARRQRDNRVMAETLEIVIGHLWDGANIKKRINDCTRSALTIGVGWEKAMWYTNTTANDPITVTKLNSLQENIAKLKMHQNELAEGDLTYTREGSDEEVKIADLQAQVDAIQNKAEETLSQGFVCDSLRGEDLVIAKGTNVVDYLDAPWICHKIPMPLEDAKAMFPALQGMWSKATKYYPRKPEMIENKEILQSNISEKDAETFTTSQFSSNPESETQECYVMVYEIWDRNSNAIRTAVDGIESRWAKDPISPKPTCRFYPFFLIPMGTLSNERHPQSLVSRSIKLMDEYNRIGTAETEHRRRICPKTLFKSNSLTPESMNKIQQAVVLEMVGIETVRPDEDLRTILVPFTYPQMDAALYNRQPIIAELERIWGVQEALGGSVSVAKTATEADIQQKGFNSRTDDKRDAIEDCLSDMAQYTAELAMCNLSVQEVQEIAGVDALWVNITKPEQLKIMMRVHIKAGSTGRPNTTLERQSWSMLLPQLTQGIQMIGQLRGSTPDDVADKMEALLSMTAKRSGEIIDIDSLVPQHSSQPMMPPTDPNAPADPNAQPPQGVPV